MSVEKAAVSSITMLASKIIMLKKYKLWLCVPFALIFLIDAGITLAGQPNEYWAGNRECINECFPLFAWGLSSGLWVFAFLCVMWITLFGLLILLMPDTLSEIIALALVNGHTWGIMTWLVYQIQLDYNLCLLFFVLSAAAFILSYKKMKKANHRIEPIVKTPVDEVEVQGTQANP